jgi:acetyltransferase-like isoleucine patch superfamily enzyme
MTGMPRFGDLARRFARRRNTRALWGAAGDGLLPPGARKFGAFGSGSMIIPPSRVQAPECIYIGSRVRVHEHVWLCVVPQPGAPKPRLEIGDGTSINRFVKIVCAGSVIIGGECLIGDHVFIGDTEYRHDDPGVPISHQPLETPRPVVIGFGSHIGFRAMIKPGVTLGENAYVGAGAVVTEDVPERTVVVGDPARIIRRWDPESKVWLEGDAAARPREGR